MTVVLNAGDCGSWVVDESTCEVYGHVVASDAMGDTYVIPLNATLRDMEEKLAAAVVLPTEADIHTWLAQHAKAAEQTAAPIASMKKKVIFSNSETERVELPRGLPKLVGHSSSRASASLVPPAVEASTPIVDYCNSCDAKFKGSPQDVRSRLLRHRQSCSKQKKHPTSEIESPIAQNAKDSLDESSKSSSVKHTRNVQQKATSHTSTQQPSSVPWSIRSMYSSFRKPSGHDPQQKDKGKEKSVSNSGEEKTAGFTSSTKRVATTSSTSTAKDSKKNTKDSSPRKDRPSPPLSTRFPNPSPVLTGSASGDRSSGQVSNPSPSSLSPATPTLRHVRQGEKASAPSSPRPALPQVNSHNSSHQSSSDPRHQSHNTSSGEVSYEGYTFTRCKAHHKGQKETWAVAQMVPMPVSQRDLKDQIKKSRKKHVSASDEYNDDKMKGFKRKQVDNLIRERTKIDGDYGYEYELASIKLDSRKTKSKDTETLSMQVILKRQLMAGFLHETSSEPSLDVHARLLSQVVDLTQEDRLGMLREHGGGSQDIGHWGTNVPFAGHPEHRAFPISPGLGQSFVDNRPPIIVGAPLPPVSIYPPAQGMGQPPPPPSPRPIVAHAPLRPESIYYQPPPPPYSVPLIHQDVYSDQAGLGTANKFNQKKAPKIVHHGHNPRIEHGFASSSSSSSSLSDHSVGPYSDNSWAKTDETPASTVNSSKSYESRNEKNVRKESRGGSHNKDKFIPTPLAHEPERTVYREHRRKEYRRSSLSPVRGPRDLSLVRFDPYFDRHVPRVAYRRDSSDARYHDFGPYEIEPAVSFPADRSSRHRRSSVSPGRTSHRRVSSFGPDHPYAHSSRALIPTYRRPTVYQEPPRGFPHGIDPHDYVAERRRELERWDREWLEQEERARMRREREREKFGERYECQAREKKRETERQEELESIREMKSMKETERKKEMESMKRMESMKEMDIMKEMEIRKEIERREQAMIEREQRRRSRYDDGYMPRERRYPGYYY